MRLHKIFGVLIVPMGLLATHPAWAGGTDPQNRTALHVNYNLGHHWSLAGWTIGNAQYYGTDNLNLIAGLGYQSESWWLETMLQRQFSHKGNNLMISNRFQKKFASHNVLYVEVVPFLNKRALSNRIFLDHPVTKHFGLGAETENIHRPGRDSLGAGPYMTAQIAAVGTLKFSGALSYQFRRSERNVFRLYLTAAKRWQ